MISRLHSALVEVSDLETATRDYARMLGADPVRVECVDGTGPTPKWESAFFGLANMALELRQADGNEAESGRLGQAGISLSCETEDPLPLLDARSISVESSLLQSGIVVGGLEERKWTTHRIDRAASRGISVELISGETPEIASLRRLSAVGSISGNIDPASRVRSLDHVVVMSTDAEATRSFYLDGLGLRLALDKTFPERGVRLIFFRVGGTTIEIGARVSTGEKAAAKPRAEDRFGGLAWRVPDIEAIQARLEADRFDVSEVRTGHKPGTRVCTVRDPVHGVPTLLIQPVEAK